MHVMQYYIKLNICELNNLSKWESRFACNLQLHVKFGKDYIIPIFNLSRLLFKRKLNRYKNELWIKKITKKDTECFI